MKRPPNPPSQTLPITQDLLEILGEVMGKLDLLTERIDRVERELNMQEAGGQTSTTSASTLDEATISVPHRTAITIVNHATPYRGSRMRVNPTIEIPARAGSPATLAPPPSPYHHQVPRSPRGRYQPQEEPLSPTPQTIPTQHILTPQQATSRLEVDQTRTTGPPFFVVFNGQEPGVFTDWPFVLRTCKWKKGDWKKYETRSAALQAYEDAYNHGGLRLIE